MARNIKKEVKKNKDIVYTNKDFNSLKNELKRYALTHFSDNIVDFSDASMGGLIVDLAAYVGDVMTYYIDHQFSENSLETAVERQNVERLIRDAGVEIAGPSPATVEVRVSLKVPAIKINGNYRPNSDYLPIIKNGTIFSSVSGTDFTLLDDLNYRLKNDLGDLIANYKVSNLSRGVPSFYSVSLMGMCTSAKTEDENIVVADDYVPFRTVRLSKGNVSEIISVFDSDDDEYYEVESLTNDTVYKRMDNSRQDSDLVPERLKIMHAPKRFVKSRSSVDGMTTLRFGAGSENQFDDDIIPDPSDHALKLYGDKKTFTGVTIDPARFLETRTLGITPRDTTLTIKYRHGGGLGDNVTAGNITAVKTLITSFRTSTPSSIVSQIRSSLTVTNPKPAGGGEDEPGLEELRVIASFNKGSQNRIVTREDLLARVYSLPTNFGRIYRASVRDNPNNPAAAQLHILSRNASGRLTISPDTLKENLAVYLSKFRMISDAVDVLDAMIINFGINYQVTIESRKRSDVVLGAINSKLKTYFDIKSTQIDQPIILGEVENLILNTPGVISTLSIEIVGRSGTYKGNVYSSNNFNPKRHLDRGYIFPPRGGIFELKFPNEDINGRVV